MEIFWKFPPRKRLFQNFNSETPNPEFKLLVMPLSQNYKDKHGNSYLLDGCCEVCISVIAEWEARDCRSYGIPPSGRVWIHMPV